MKQTILILGGAPAQVPVIRFAKEQGYFVITADYLPENPGHAVSDKYFNISTTDKESILKLAREQKIDAICAYASDPSAPTAAYVRDRLGLIGSSYKSVQTLSNKTLFRAFLKANLFASPWFCHGTTLKELLAAYPGGKAIIKPADSSGSKGIFRIEDADDIKQYYDEALRFSRSGRVILEQFIQRKGPQIHGEGFVVNHEVRFLELGDQYFSTVNELVPYSTILPSSAHTDVMPKVHALVKEVIRKVGFHTGGINVEVIRDQQDQLFVLEIGARNGGNFMPQLMKAATGFDLVGANVESLFGKEIQHCSKTTNRGYYAQLILHATRDTVFSKVNIPALLEECILEADIFAQPGQVIPQYRNSRDVAGVMIFRLDTNEQLECYMDALRHNQWIE